MVHGLLQQAGYRQRLRENARRLDGENSISRRKTGSEDLRDNAFGSVFFLHNEEVWNAAVNLPAGPVLAQGSTLNLSPAAPIVGAVTVLIPTTTFSGSGVSGTFGGVILNGNAALFLTNVTNANPFTQFATTPVPGIVNGPLYFISGSVNVVPALTVEAQLP